MRKIEEQIAAANFMAAAAHLLVGTSGRHRELNDRIAIVFGPSIDPLNLVNWARWTRSGGRSIVHFSFPSGENRIPDVSLIARHGDAVRIFDSCLLWLRRDGAPVDIIPCDFRSGGYRVGAELDLVHTTRLPAPNMQSAIEGASRAYDRLLEIVHERKEMGIGPELDLPALMEKRAA